MFNLKKKLIKIKDIKTTIIIVNQDIKINNKDIKTNMVSIMIKEKSATIPKSLKCPKNPKLNQIKPNSTKKLINFKPKSSNSKNSENKKKITTKMVLKSSPIKLKLKSITLTSLKLVSLCSTMTKITLKKILMMLKTKLINTEKKLISSTDLLKELLKPIKLKKWTIKNLSDKKKESPMKCQSGIFQKLKKLNFLTN